MDIRHAVGVKAGIDSETLAAVASWRDSERFTVRERAAMALCEAVVRDDLAVSDECFAGVREHFSEAETVELVFVIGYQVFASKFAKAFQVAPQGFSLDLGTVRDQDRKERTSPGGTAAARPGQSS